MNRHRYKYLGQTLLVHIRMNPGTLDWRRSFINAICDVLASDNPKFDRKRFITESRLTEVLELDYKGDPNNDNDNGSNRKKA